MTGNKPFFSLVLVGATFFFFASVFPLAAQTPSAVETTASPPPPQNSVMGMAFVQEIVVQSPRFGNIAESKGCGLDERDISDFVFHKMKLDGLPVHSLLDAPPIDPQKARIYILPEVTTMEIKDVACMSYVALSARATASVVVDPIPVPRNVTLSFWNGGVMVNSSNAGHKRMTEGGLERLSERFSRDFRLAQPPTLNR